MLIAKLRVSWGKSTWPYFKVICLSDLFKLTRWSSKFRFVSRVSVCVVTSAWGAGVGLRGHVFDQLRNWIAEDYKVAAEFRAPDQSSVTRLMADCFSLLGLAASSWLWCLPCRSTWRKNNSFNLNENLICNTPQLWISLRSLWSAGLLFLQWFDEQMLNHFCTITRYFDEQTQYTHQTWVTPAWMNCG